MYAADAGQVEICRVLLGAGADPLQCNDEGRDAQFFALKNGSSEVVGVLRRFLGNSLIGVAPAAEGEVSQSGAVDFDVKDAVRLPSLDADQELDITGWTEELESATPSEDPMLVPAAVEVQGRISIHIARLTMMRIGRISRSIFLTPMIVFVKSGSWSSGKSQLLKG
jgi:hypothetical protein